MWVVNHGSMFGLSLSFVVVVCIVSPTARSWEVSGGGGGPMWYMIDLFQPLILKSFN